MNKNLSKLNWDQFQDLSEEEIEEAALKVLKMMKLEQKVTQMNGDVPLLRGIIPMMRRYNSKPYVAGEVKQFGIPGILFADGPRGVVMGSSTCFPVSMARGAAWDPDLEQRIGDAIGIEIRAQGGNFFGGVCINLLRHPAWGRAQETYGEDPVLLGMTGSALVKGAQRHVMACAKHFACNSMENARFKVDVTVDERTLREVYLPHFKQCVDSGVASIMSAYNKVNGEYCGHNKNLLREILKEDWGFKGFVISDFVFGVRDAKKGALGGLDIEMPFQFRMSPKKLLKRVRKGEIPENIIDDAVLRILRQKLRFNRNWDAKLYSKSKIACEEHVKLALEAARKGVVLLKNDSKLLPLSRGSIKNIAVIGKLAARENTGDKGSSRVYAPYVITPLEGIKAAAGSGINVTFDDGKDKTKVRTITKNADVVIIVAGYTAREEGEYIFGIGKGGDRDSLELLPVDEELIQLVSSINRNTIVLLQGGSAIITETWRNSVPTILMIWYLGMEGGRAIGEILFGDVNPSGKLPVSFPKTTDQLPFFDKNAETITYDYYHGYKFMEKYGHVPAFPFGFGLSYTTFSYGNLTVNKSIVTKQDTLQITVDVSNTGNVAGDEIVQLYVGYGNSSVNRPVKELKNFKRIKLELKETKTVQLELATSDVAYFNTDTKKWEIEELDYKILVGGSSRDEDLLTTEFRIQDK